MNPSKPVSSMNPIYRKLLQPLKHSVRIKSFLYRCIWALPERYRSQTPIRGALKELAAQRGRQVTLVNIGANDGLAGDPLREFILTRRWHGLLVEPVPYVFARLQKAYRNVPGVAFEQSAVGEQDTTATFWFLRKNRKLPPGYDQIGSFSRDNLLLCDEMFPGLEPFITSIEVPCLTLKSLFQKHALTQVDIIFIDAEGYDGKIVKQIDFTHPPRLVIFECHMLSAGEFQECQQFLRQHGYQVSDDGYNTVARRF